MSATPADMKIALKTLLLQPDHKPALIPVLISCASVALAGILASIMVLFGLNENGLLFICVTVFIGICVTIPAGYTHYLRDRRILEQRESLRILASTDSLTGTLNRRSFEALIEAQQKLMQNTGQDASVILFDIDWFKTINDTFGHVVGDQVLTKVADTARKSLRQPSDVIARWGGEEFAILLTNVTPRQAYFIADRLRQSFADTSFSEIAPGLTLTASFGVAALSSNAKLTRVLADADQALYEAKAAGRNTTRTLNTTDRMRQAV
ncbi:GGDEF domain-containing protein [Henriciella litoralis]|uniref:GGDEF domain-containing protein n=1 Tax=Henriciella litoralis TaxID=568102 RepID=UPI000A04E7EC|nr:GGDEF domain-containing protein [Henriciella litoralis]